MPLWHTSFVTFDWDPEKNRKLKETREVSFESVVVHLGRGDLWKVADHPNQERYRGQKLFFVLIQDYVYIVPYEMRDEVIWLITIIPSRKATKERRKEQENE